MGEMNALCGISFATLKERDLLLRRPYIVV